MTRETSARDGLGRNGVSVIVPPSWTSTLTWSPAFRCARSINAASNMTPCELPILVIFLTMLLNYVLLAVLSNRRSQRCSKKNGLRASASQQMARKRFLGPVEWRTRLLIGHFQEQQKCELLDVIAV